MGKFNDPVPTYCQGVQGLEETPALVNVAQHIWLFTEEGQTVLRRLLWCTQLTSKVEFCPFLPNLFSTLLAFFNEEESFYIVHRIISEMDMDPHPEKSANP